jgi:hypothetical protein
MASASTEELLYYPGIPVPIQFIDEPMILGANETYGSDRRIVSVYDKYLRSYVCYRGPGGLQYIQIRNTE